ncbi:MAG: hypothetical protein ACRCXZ_00725 [Patescibacteria group bacterium]
MNILKLDYSNHFNTLYFQAKKYMEPPYQFTYLPNPSNCIPNEKGVWTRTTSSIDCIAYVLIVLRDLSIMGCWNFPDYRIEDYNSILEQGVNERILIKRDVEMNFEAPSCGIFLALKSCDGMIKRGQRHMGFYFCFGDKVHILHNSRYHGLLGGVSEQNFSYPEFIYFINSYYRFYTTND